MSDKLKIVFLGTSSGVPTSKRSPCSLAVKANGHFFLIDCAENAQQRLMQAKLSYLKVEKIFLTHLHGDHFFGLLGLLATMAMHQRQEPIYIFGPKGTKEIMKKIKGFWDNPLPFDVEVNEIAREGLVWDEKEFELEAVRVKHSVPCFGYVFREKLPLGKFNKQKALKLNIPEGPLFSKLQHGETIEWNGKKIKPEMVLEKWSKKNKSFAYIVDTVPFQSYIEKIKNIQLLIHEASFLDELKERAAQVLHSTALQAGMVAQKAKAEKLILTHISARYGNVEKHEMEARREFGNVQVAEDLMEIEL